jgi:hypothetical protein
MTLRLFTKTLLLLGIISSIFDGLRVNTLSAQTASPAFKTGGMPKTKDGTKIIERTLLLRPATAVTAVDNRLYPSTALMRPGDAAPIFLRINSENLAWRKAVNQLNLEECLDMNLQDLKVEEIEQARASVIRSEMRRLVFRRTAGWQYPIFEEPHFSILLPDVQESRGYVRAMTTFARAAILKGDIPKAEEWLLYSTGLARHVGESPFAIVQMVRAAETNDALNVTEELIQHPSSSNYYWDLTAIPSPTSSIRDSATFESAGWENTIVALKNLDALKLEEQWTALAGQIQAYLSELTPSKSTSLLDADWIKHARNQLPTAMPAAADRVPQMSDAEVSVRYWWIRTQHFTHKIRALATLKPHQAIEQLRNLDTAGLVVAVNEAVVDIGLDTLVTSMVLQLTLLEQHIEMLRAIESIRDWSAKNGGKLPNKLELLELPIARDPLSDQPFEWKLSQDGKEGVLSGLIPGFSNKFVGEGWSEGGRIYRIVID